MSGSSRDSSDSKTAGRVRCLRLCAVCCVLCATLGCEGWQKKFVRKRKKPVERPAPVVQFQDYTRAMTPLDRYRKHLLMFDYWNAELVGALEPHASNPKRIRRASAESLQELRTLARLLQDNVAAQLNPLVEQRARLDAQLQRGLYAPSQHDALRRQVEAQTREFERQFSWRDVQDHLNDEAASGGP